MNLIFFLFYGLYGEKNIQIGRSLTERDIRFFNIFRFPRKQVVCEKCLHKEWNILSEKVTSQERSL